MFKLAKLAGMLLMLAVATSALAQEPSWRIKGAADWRKSAAQSKFSQLNCRTLLAAEVTGCKQLKEEFFVNAMAIAVSLEDWDAAVQKSDWEAAASAHLRNYDLYVKRGELYKRDWITENYFKSTKWTKQNGWRSSVSGAYREESQKAADFRDSYCDALAGEQAAQCRKDWSEYAAACDRSVETGDALNKAYEDVDKVANIEAYIANQQAHLKALTIKIRVMREYMGLNSSNH